MPAVASVSPPRYRWIVLVLTVAAFIFTFVTRFAWPPLIPVVVPALGISMSLAGAYMSAFYIGYVITQIPAGVLADRFGVRAMLAGSLVVEGLTTLAMGAINGYDMGFALRVATGLGAGAVYSCCARALMEWFPASERGRAFGIMLAAPSAGLLLSNVVVPPLNAGFGWRGAFMGVGAATVVVGALIYVLLRTSNTPRNEGNPLVGFKVVFGSRDLILTAAAGFCLMWLELSTATWANAHMKNVGLATATAAQVMVLYSLGGMLSPLVSGFVSDIIGRRSQIVILAYLIVAPITVWFGYQTDFVMLSAVAFLMGFVSYLANPQLTILISQFAGKEWAATANGVGNFIFQMASIIGPWFVGLSIDMSGNFGLVWWIMAAGPILGIFLMLPVRDKLARD